MAALYRSDSHSVPRPGLLGLLLAGPPRVVVRIHRRRAHPLADRHPHPLVRHFRAACLPRSVLRVQEGRDRVPRGDLQHPPPDPHAGLVPESDHDGASRWNSALRRLLRRAVLHHVIDLDGPVLLCVRFPASCLRHPHCDLCRDHHRSQLFPTVSTCIF